MGSTIILITIFALIALAVICALCFLGKRKFSGGVRTNISLENYLNELLRSEDAVRDFNTRVLPEYMASPRDKYKYLHDPFIADEVAKRGRFEPDMIRDVITDQKYYDSDILFDVIGDKPDTEAKAVLYSLGVFDKISDLFLANMPNRKMDILYKYDPNFSEFPKKISKPKLLRWVNEHVDYDLYYNCVALWDLNSDEFGNNNIICILSALEALIFGYYCRNDVLDVRYVLGSGSFNIAILCTDGSGDEKVIRSSFTRNPQSDDNNALIELNNQLGAILKNMRTRPDLFMPIHYCSADFDRYSRTSLPMRAAYWIVTDRLDEIYTEIANATTMAKYMFAIIEIETLIEQWGYYYHDWKLFNLMSNANGNVVLTDIELTRLVDGGAAWTHKNTFKEDIDSLSNASLSLSWRERRRRVARLIILKDLIAVYYAHTIKSNEIYTISKRAHGYTTRTDPYQKAYMHCMNDKWSLSTLFKCYYSNLTGERIKTFINQTLQLDATKERIVDDFFNDIEQFSDDWQIDTDDGRDNESPSSSSNSPGNTPINSPGNSGNSPGNTPVNSPGNSGNSPSNSGNSPGYTPVNSPGNSGNSGDVDGFSDFGNDDDSPDTTSTGDSGTTSTDTPGNSSGESGDNNGTYYLYS